jgi:nucleotide-binding universal stress UspA family protein
MRTLVEVDPSDAGDTALREAAALASAPPDALAAVRVLPRPEVSPESASSVTEYRSGIFAELGKIRKALEERVQRACGRMAEIFIVVGRPASRAIVERAREWGADRVVLSVDGPPEIVRLRLDLAGSVARHAACDVLLVRSHKGDGWVLAATDGSDPSLPAVLAAAAEARRRLARLEVLQPLGVLDAEAIYLLGPGMPGTSVVTPFVREVVGRQLCDRAARLGISAECKVVDRPAAKAILREANEIGADLVVMAPRERRGLMGLIHRRTSDRVLRSALCSVLVVNRHSMPSENPARSSFTV